MLIYVPYIRSQAVQYARKWALSRNPLFADFTGIGGNCTNFVSQCILAGVPVMNYTPTYGWYYISPEKRSPSWAGVNELYAFLTGATEFSSNNFGYGPFATDAKTSRSLDVGDVIQLGYNGPDEFSHSLIISGFADNDVLVCANTDNALDRPLSTYNYSAIRVLHIEGALAYYDSERIFENLLDGTALPFVPTGVNVDELNI